MPLLHSRLRLAALLLAVLLTPSAHAQYVAVIDTDRDVLGLAVDADGNAYLTGSNSAIGFTYGFDPDGNQRFLYDFGGSAIDVDAAGNLYVAGSFYDEQLFNPHGPDSDPYTLSTPDEADDGYVASYTQDGGFRFARSISSRFFRRTDAATDLVVDAAGTSYVTGWFEGVVDFDPGPGVVEVEGTDPDFISDPFIVSYGPDGAARFANKYGNESYGGGMHIAIDAQGNSYISGYSAPGRAQDGYEPDIFVASYDASGALRYGRNIAQGSSHGRRSLAVDADGHLLLAGTYHGTFIDNPDPDYTEIVPEVDFDPGPGVVERTRVQGAMNYFLLRYEPDGSFRSVSTSLDPGFSGLVANDENGEPRLVPYLPGAPDRLGVPGVAPSEVIFRDGYVYVAGTFSGTVDFDPGPGVDERTATGSRDIFLVKRALPSTPPPCSPDLRITSFDADGDPGGEVIEVTNSGSGAASLGGCSFAVLSPFTERVTYAERLPQTSLTAGGSFLYSPPPGTLPDGPGALGVFAGTDIAVGTRVTALFGTQVASVVYLDEDHIVGRFPGAGKHGDLPAALAALRGEAAGDVPASFALSRNYPNPFNPQTTIRYALPEAADVRLVVFDVLGRAVRTLVAAPQAAGRYEVTWDGRDAAGLPVPSGVYLYRLDAGAEAASRAMLLAK